MGLVRRRLSRAVDWLLRRRRSISPRHLGRSLARVVPLAEAYGWRSRNGTVRAAPMYGPKPGAELDWHDPAVITEAYAAAERGYRGWPGPPLR